MARRNGYFSPRNRIKRANKARNRRRANNARRKRQNAYRKRREKKFGRVYHSRAGDGEGSPLIVLIFIFVVFGIIVAIPLSYPVLGTIGGYIVGTFIFIFSEESSLNIAGWIMFGIGSIITIVFIICCISCIISCICICNGTCSKIDKYLKRLGKKKDALNAIGDFQKVNNNNEKVVIGKAIVKKEKKEKQKKKKVVSKFEKFANINEKIEVKNKQYKPLNVQMQNIDSYDIQNDEKVQQKKQHIKGNDKASAPSEFKDHVYGPVDNDNYISDSSDSDSNDNNNTPLSKEELFIKFQNNREGLKDSEKLRLLVYGLVDPHTFDDELNTEDHPQK